VWANDDLWEPHGFCERGKWGLAWDDWSGGTGRGRELIVVSDQEGVFIELSFDGEDALDCLA